ncbi:MAG: iron ABC transporter permease, partial [Planctomycetota bacterium JB042]
MSARALRPSLLLPVAAVLLLLVAWPTVHVLARALTGDGGGLSLEHFARFFDPASPANLLALWNSTWISIASVLGAALIGVPLALLVTRVEFPLRGAVAALAVLPLLLPPIVGVLAFKEFLFGEYGIVPR